MPAPSDVHVTKMIVVDLLPTGMPKQKRTNWAANIIYCSINLHEVTSVEEIQTLVQSQKKVTVVGTGHTFNNIADNPDNNISLRLLDNVVTLDAVACTVTVCAGITYDQLCLYLDQNGFALHNLASVTTFTVAGACNTASHGSGDKNGNLATSVSALEMITAEGDLVKFSRQSDGEVFCGVVVGLGALGIITQITLDIQPAYMMHQYVYEDLPFNQLKDNFDNIMSSGYSVSLFTDWQDQLIDEVWIKIKGDEQTFPAPQEYYGAKLANRHFHPVRTLSAEKCTEQMGVPGPSYKRLPHFHVGIPGVGEELQSEYFVARHLAVDAIFALEPLHEQIGPLLHITEIRSIASDDLWMSPCYRRPSVAIHFTWKHDWPAVQRLLPKIERVLSPFDPRPHWGKLFTMPPAELQSKYEKLDDFRQLASKLDPKGKFRNEYLNTNIFTFPN